MHRTIRMGCDFHLAAEMEEVRRLRAENARLRRNKAKRRKRRT